MRLPTCVLALLLAGATPAAAQGAANVLLVVNERSADSVRIGEYYAAKRALPEHNVVRISAPVTETVARADYVRAIETPIGSWLSAHRLQDAVLYLVLTKGVPLRIAGTGGRDGLLASVDSELTLLYRKLVGIQPPLVGHVDNPYFLGSGSIENARAFSRTSSDIYLVTRLDGFTVEDALGLVDRGVAPSPAGTIVLDGRGRLDRTGDEWLAAAADLLLGADAGPGVLHDATADAAVTNDPVIGYYSWGSNDAANRRRTLDLRFAPGAIGATFLSTDGRTFVEPPPDWEPSEPGRGRLFAGSFQSLAGDLIRGGMTGVAAHVSEPFLDATIRPQVLFPAYAAGFNLAEAFYLAMPYVSWQTIVIGDPLCMPFPRVVPGAADPPVALDPDTELPRVFSDRRAAVLADGGLNVDAVKLVLKAESRLASGEGADGEALLAEATRLEPRLTEIHVRLAAIAEGRRDYEAAAARYRLAVAHDPEHAIALNNLAYVLAEHLQAPDEALALAQRAYRLAREPLIADTVGWIHHLLGDDRAALPYVEAAMTGAANNIDVLVHSAVVHAALGDSARAARDLDAAEKISPDLAERPDVVALREKLRTPAVRSRSMTPN